MAPATTLLAPSIGRVLFRGALAAAKAQQQQGDRTATRLQLAAARRWLQLAKTNEAPTTPHGQGFGRSAA